MTSAGPNPGDLAVASAIRSAVIAVDGPSGSGKSSVSRGVAQRLGLRYLDTGAMYRALTWSLLAQTVDVNDPVAVAKHAGTPRAHDLHRPGTPGHRRRRAGRLRADPRRRGDGSRERRQRRARGAGPPGRDAAGRRRRAAASSSRAATSARSSCPDATLKVFLTANAEIRSLRRAEELRAKGIADAETDDTLRSIERRDRLDSTRAVSPLLRAEDAVEVDATDLNLEQVIDRVVTLVLERVTAQVGAP